MREIPEGAVFENVEESAGDDLKLFFSNGAVLEVYSAPCEKKLPPAV